MRRMKWLAAIIVCFSVLVAGCGTKDAEAVVKDLDKVMGSMKSYRGSGTMTLHTGQQPLNYQVEVWYQQPQYYRIALTNEKKDITQVVLRNDDGVFVLTPKLNKSFRFQSDWPQDQGQVYLYQTLVQSILKDNQRQFVMDEESYVFDVMANYQNASLARQKIWLDKTDYKPKHVEVSDANAKVMVEVDFKSFEFDVTFDKNAFDMKANMGAQGGVEDEAEGMQEDQDAMTGVQPGEAADEEGLGTDSPDSGAQPDEQTDGKLPVEGEDGEGTGKEAEPGSGEPGEEQNEGAASSGEEVPMNFVTMAPSYFPEGVSLHEMNDITIGGSKGVMQRYSGTYDYTLIQSMPEDEAVFHPKGTWIDLGHTWGLLAGEEQRTLAWTYDGYEYRLTTATLPEAEMFKVAQSVMEEMGK
ncbi:DUF4367 domain-containing protein [Paenibacillus tarimensis]|uniref:DUF4367 domain-containing protein n=1 Tax=Paenibacillus tarimensis TaxID=416012 RepID=UPI001F40051C|nr:DUF4367 domain-containing protein [Paenibacillus tarimensis]MCF2945942.1 DUF4367 domain-containing protein [Paenibacillus tarimensis]